MALVLYVSAVLATNLFGVVAPEFFGNLGASLFTLFQVMTVEGWPDIARRVMAQSPYAWMFFVAYLLIATFMVLNLFIAVVVNATAVAGRRGPEGRWRGAHPVDSRRGSRVTTGARGVAQGFLTVTSRRGETRTHWGVV